MNYYYYYYVQTDILCLVLLGIMLQRSRAIANTHSAPQRLFTIITYTAIISAISDLLACLVRGQFFPGARFLIHLLNIIYIESITVIAGAWCIYVFQKTGLQLSVRSKALLRIPFILTTILIITNPVTGLMFTVNSENLYVRGTGLLLHWVCSWFYYLFATVFLMMKIRRESSRMRRREMMPMLAFIIAPTIAAVLQMIFYGVATTQAGLTVSIVMIYLNVQENLISKDELTGVNNRMQLTQFVENLVAKSVKQHILVVITDINSFKKINDTYGHLSGDRALVTTAQALRRVCEKSGLPLFLCRYGGDEFVISGICNIKYDLNTLRQSIHTELQQCAKDAEYPFSLNVSVGIASGLCETAEDFNHYLRMADESMYDDKKRHSQM